MRKILSIALFIIAVNIGFAQNSAKIIGKWAYTDLHDKANLEEMDKEMAIMLFKDLILNFRADNSMSIAMRKTPDEATYSFDTNNDNMIIAESSGKKPMSIMIIKLTDDELILKLGQLAAMVLKKVSNDPDLATLQPATITATLKQISGKWFVIGIGDKKISDLGAEIMNDSYVQFNQDGKYSAKVLSIKQNGTWEFGKGNSTIIVETEDGRGIWSVYAISDNELIMQNDTSAKRMIFSRKP